MKALDLPAYVWQLALLAAARNGLRSVPAIERYVSLGGVA